MKSQKLNPIEVKEAIDKALMSLQIGSMREFDVASTELVNLLRVKNRNHWWEVWRPKYRYPELDSNIDFKVDLDKSMPKVGRVIKATARPEYDPTNRPKGGRVTKAMPRQLRKIKEGQEAQHDPS